MRRRKRRPEPTREERLRRIKKMESRMLGLSAALCVAMAGAGWVYKRNNTVPDVVVPETPRPARNGYDLIARAVEMLPRDPGTTSSVRAFASVAVSPLLDWRNMDTPAEFGSHHYNRLYPLQRQLKYLRQNARALSLLRQGLRLPYVQPAQDDELPRVDYYGERQAARLLILEAQVRARQGDYQGAAHSLEDAMSFGYAVPHGGSLSALSTGNVIRSHARDEFEWLGPRLDAKQLRRLALRLEAMHQARVLMPQVLLEDKRATQRYLLRLMRLGDLRILYGYAVSKKEAARPFDAPPLEQRVADHQEELDRLPRLIQMQLAWKSKASILSEHARCLDWQIAQAKLPHSLREKSWAFPEPGTFGDWSDQLNFATYPECSGAQRLALKHDTLDALAFTALALRAFQADHKYLPRRLDELVPRYLSRVPTDPFDPRRTLGYRPQPIHALWIESRPKLVQPPTPVVKTPQGWATATPFPHWSAGTPTPMPLRGAGPPTLAPTPAPTSSASDEDEPEITFCPVAPPPPEETMQKTKHISGAPWTLWSLGPDGRDDNGLPFRKSSSSEMERARFRVSSMESTTRADIVAGINY